MANAEGVNPAPHEIERQLDRMLAHPLFQAREKQAAIFKYLVKSFLDGKEVTQQTIFDEFFTDKRYAEDTTSARTNVSIIRRELLERYYEEDGKHDPVIISLPAPERIPLPNGKYKIIKLPPGQAYTPEFRYNPRSAIAKEFAIAHHLLGGSPAQVQRGFGPLVKIFALESDHPEAVLDAVEAFAGQMMLGMHPDFARDMIVAGGLNWIANIAPQVPGYWRVPMVRGLLHFCGGDTEAAGKEFDSALALDRQSVSSRGWYTLFLFATGRQEDALNQAGLYAEERAGNSYAQALHGIYLTRTQRFEEAERVFAEALALDRNCWIAHYGMTQVYLATGKQELVYEHSKRLSELVEPWEYEDLRRRLSPEPPAR